jgi:Domain of Unknown Function (DUF1206)
MTTYDTKTEDVGSQQAERFTREHPGLVKMCRVGWAAKGVVYVLIGFLALFIALDSRSGGGGGSSSGGQEASAGGAIAQIAESSGGALLLYVIAAGLVLFSIWRIISVMLPASSDMKSWLNRIGYLISAGTYLLVAWTAVSFARYPGGGGQQSEDSKIETFTADLLGKSYGRALVFIIGAVLICVAASFLWKAITASFTSQLAGGGVGPISHHTLVLMGRIGWVGRTAMMGLIGFFICRAAVEFDAEDAQGLDGSLRHATESGPGTALVLVVAVGLFVYGLFCVISAPRRLLVAADQ